MNLDILRQVQLSATGSAARTSSLVTTSANYGQHLRYSYATLLVDPVTQCDLGLLSRRDDSYVIFF
jgi:hypothetical protein